MAADAPFRMRVEGARELERNLKAIRAEFFAEMKKAIPAEAASLKSMADGQAPRGTGTLAASSVVSTTVRRSGVVRSAVAYTDEKAAAVHEGIHWGRHRKTKHMKWLQKAAEVFAPGFATRMVAVMRRLVGSP